MNYAVDRLDRRARHQEGTNALWKDYCSALSTNDHELLARTLRDVGWNRFAVYHYALRWCSDPSSHEAAGDYAQMVELAGFPEIGMLALLHFRARGKLQSPDINQEASTQTHHLVVEQDCLLRTEPEDGHCGCGNTSCGSKACFIPMVDMEPIFSALELFSSDSVLHPYSKTSSHILNQLAKGERPMMENDDWIPEILKFWNDIDDSDYRTLSPVLQLLLIKQAYLGMPLLATEAMARTIHLNNQMKMLAASHKSHHAYFVLIRAVVLGKRVKGHKREWHISIWDRMHSQPSLAQTHTAECKSINTLLPQLVHSLKHDQSIPQLWFCQQGLDNSSELGGELRNEHHLFLLGDSHVLSLAWQKVCIPDIGSRLVVPVVVTGLKAWHVRKDTRFFTLTNLRILVLSRLWGLCRTIVISAGEIDCREGLGGPLLEGYSDQCVDHVYRTVQAYVDALDALAVEAQVQFLVMPVAPHLDQSTGRPSGQVHRRQTTKNWNSRLKELLPTTSNRVFLLDYEDDLLDERHRDLYTLKPEFDADGTHMNSAFRGIFGDAIARCGCDLSSV